MLCLAAAIACLFSFSCFESPAPPQSQTEQDVQAISAGELHNDLVTTYIEATHGNRGITERDRITLFVTVSQEIFARKGIEFVPTEETVHAFMEMWKRWMKTDTDDFTAFYKVSPMAIIDELEHAEAIHPGDAVHLKNLFAEMKRTGASGTDPRRSIYGTPAGSTEPLKMAYDVSRQSMNLWFDLNGDEKTSIDPDEMMLDSWWKTVVKYVTLAGSDTIATVLGTYAFANPAAGVFCGALASVAVYDAFDERGW